MEKTLDGIRDLRLYQNKNGYRFSVDALLLYSFVNVKYAKEIVDLGAGSGIIGLLLAGKYKEAKVVLVEIQKSLYQLAERNALLNGLEDRVKVLPGDINHIDRIMRPMSYDLAVSNPPFRKKASGLISVEEEKAVARHELRIKLSGLAESASYLLRSRGRFFMIFHPERILEVVDTLRQRRLEPKRIRFVHNDLDSGSKIVLVEAVKDGRAGLKIERPLYIYNRDGSYTDEVREMYI
jgi:tRNA1Val (adenine37-N6)-methyltransferase